MAKTRGNEMKSNPSCLGCEFSEPYAPKHGRSAIKYRCVRLGFDVDASTIPGQSISCDLFRAPELPFAFDDEMPAHLL